MYVECEFEEFSTASRLRNVVHPYYANGRTGRLQQVPALSRVSYNLSEYLNHVADYLDWLAYREPDPELKDFLTKLAEEVKKGTPPTKKQ